MGKTETKSVLPNLGASSILNVFHQHHPRDMRKTPHSCRVPLADLITEQRKKCDKNPPSKKRRRIFVAKSTELIDSMAGLSAEKEECPSFRPLSGVHLIFFSSRIHKSETAAWT